MNINRHNYEEFFILYLDNELSSEDRSRVELFAQQHPDLQEELSMLQQSKLAPDMALVFEDKESMMKSSVTDFITLDNYEEWLVLYIDNELIAEQKAAVETFATSNPSVKKELGLLQKLKLQPENIVYADKATLYRKEETTRRIVPIFWWRVAAAVILIIALTIGGFSIFSTKNKPASLADTEIKNKVIKTPNLVAKTAVENKQNNTGLTTTNAIKEEIANTQVKKQQTPVEGFVIKKKDANRIKEKKMKEDEAVLATTTTIEKNKNNLPDPVYNPNIKGNINTNDKLIAYAAPSKEALTNQKEFKLTSTVTPDIDHTSDLPDTEIADGKKNKFRGFLRKITRTFEKTTNIKATDEDDRLLVAGLAIRL